jgi:DNA-binding transcriptional MerR regulator
MLSNASSVVLPDMKKRIPKPQDPLDIGGVDLETYGTGEVAAILGVEVWRVQKYLDSPKYRLSPAGQLGTGRGSRRVFTTEDIYRLGIAEHLVRGGFSYKFVAQFLQQVDDDDLLGGIGKEGEELDRVCVVAAGDKGEVSVRTVDRAKTVGELTKSVKGPSFYLLDLTKVVAEIQKRMRG